MADNSEWLVELLRYMPGPGLVLDEGTIVAVNDELPLLWGIPRARLSGAPLVDFAIPEHQEALEGVMSGLQNSVDRAQFRLAASFAPMEVTFRRISDRILVGFVRSMEGEHRLSAIAGSDLTHDIVTGLSNRHHVLEELHHRLHTQPVQPMALIGVWVDELSDLQAERGKRVGEMICRQVAERISAKLRGTDLLGRIQDDAFLALLVTDSPLDQLSVVADRLRDEVSFPVEFDGGLVSFTSSVMVGTVGKKPPSIERILSRIEAVSKRAAASGGNRTDILTL